MAILLVRHRDCVVHPVVGLDGVLNSVRADPRADVAVRDVDDALALRVPAKPEHLVGKLLDRVLCGAAKLVEGACDALKRKVRPARVVPDLSRERTKDPYLAVADKHRQNVVRRALGAGKVQRIDRGAVQQFRHPQLLAVWLAKDKVPVNEPDR